MNKFDVGDKAEYLPNQKVDTWTVEILQTPPVTIHLDRFDMENPDLNRYRCKVLSNPGARSIVNLKPSELKPEGYYND